MTGCCAHLAIGRTKVENYMVPKWLSFRQRNSSFNPSKAVALSRHIGPPTVKQKDLLARAAERRMLLAIDAAWHYEWSKTRWWFQRLFFFTPIWGRFPIWLFFFSNGLKPPTRNGLKGCWTQLPDVLWFLFSSWFWPHCHKTPYCHTKNCHNSWSFNFLNTQVFRWFFWRIQLVILTYFNWWKWVKNCETICDLFFSWGLGLL